MDMTSRLTYTGIDKLLMAAMMDESATQKTHIMAHNSVPTGYLPCGRGIGYLGSNIVYATAAAYNQIPAPSNKSELELYHLLERANLLTYFETFLRFGK